MVCGWIQYTDPGAEFMHHQTPSPILSTPLVHHSLNQSHGHIEASAFRFLKAFSPIILE